jgi:hypothetical protein
MKIFAQYCYNLLVMLSQLGSVLLGGHPDKSISQRTGEAFIAHRNTFTFRERWFTAQMQAIDLLFWNRFWKLEEWHCINSLRGESKAKELWDWTK